MLKIANKELDRLEKQYRGIARQIRQFENAVLPQCPRCGSKDTADVQCGIIGRTINIAAATTKFKLIPNGPAPGKYFCNACNEFFDWTKRNGDSSMKAAAAKSKTAAALTSRFLDAVQFAFAAHSEQTRKGSDTPYIGHLLHVASNVIDAGGTEELAVAALLHDAVEDQGGVKMLTAIREKFGDRVAQIVEACSDSVDGEKRPPWRERKEAYIERLSSADADVRLVSAADKLSNARAIVSDLRTIGERLWDRFNAPKDDQLWYYRAIVFALQDAQSDERVTKVLNELVDVVRQMRELSGGLDSQELLTEAAFYAGASDYRRAIQSARMALVAGATSSQLAEGLEIIERCVDKLEGSKGHVEEAQQDALHHPQNGEKLFYLGLTLSRAGDLPGSTAAYERALKFRKSMCVATLRDCLNNIGWNYFRRGEYAKSLIWFKRSLNTPNPEDPRPYPLALENMVLANARLGRVPAVAKLTEQYVYEIGRLPQYERMIVGKLGIDADVLYVERTKRVTNAD